MFSNLGITMALSVYIGYRIGDFLDVRFHSYPWITLFFSLCGIGAGFKGVFRILKEEGLDKEDARR